jgi:predicted DNA-binding transcriptional regulator
MSKDQAIGATICTACVIIGALYTVGLFYFGNPLSSWPLEFRLIAVPVFLALIAILGIGAWIGWTMATTPPPKPIEEITSEIEEKSEEESKTQQKAEE